MANSVDPFLQQAKNNIAASNQQGDDQKEYLRRRAGYYDPLEENYRQSADAAANDLQQTPGYTADEATGIMGNPNAAMGYYNPDQLSGDMFAGNAGVANAATNYGSGVRQAATRTGDSLAGAAGNIHSDLYGAANDLSSGVTGAANDLNAGVTSAADKAAGYLGKPADDQLNWQGGVYDYLKGQNEGALGDYGSKLSATADPSKLGLSSDFAGKYAMSPEEVQNIKDVAAQSTAGQYGKMAGETKLRAAADGNTSPAAMAAIEQNLGRQGAIDAGNAASSAELAANAQQAARAKDLESMRIGTQQDLSSRGQQNAASLYQAQAGGAQNLAGLEQQGIQSATGNRINTGTTAAQLGYNAAATGGNAKLTAAQLAGQGKLAAANSAAGYGYNAADAGANADMSAASAGGQAGIDAAKYEAGNTLAVDAGNQATGQSLATAADTARSNRTAGVAGQRIAGNTAYRGYLTGQQGAAQQGSENNASQEISNYGTQGSLANTATGQGLQAATAKDAKPGLLSQVVGGVTGAVGALGGGAGIASLAKLADGGVATKPTEAIVGENNRPERIVQMRRYRMPCAA